MHYPTRSLAEVACSVSEHATSLSVMSHYSFESSFYSNIATHKCCCFRNKDCIYCVNCFTWNN